MCNQPAIPLEYISHFLFSKKYSHGKDQIWNHHWKVLKVPFKPNIAELIIVFAISTHVKYGSKPITTASFVSNKVHGCELFKEL